MFPVDIELERTLRSLRNLGDTQGENINEYQGQKRTQPFEEQMLQFMGDNKRLLNLYEHKLAELEAFKSNTDFSNKHKCFTKEFGNTGWVVGIDLTERDQECFP